MPHPTGYTLTSYGEMIANEPRTPAYADALRGAITPGCKVIDIGAGPGLFSLLACQFGAGEVIAIEPHDSVLLLNEAAKANGVDDKITVVHNLSIAYSSDRCADVIVSDLRGILPLFEGHIPAIIDARERLMAPGGTLIPARDLLYVSLVEDENTRRQIDQPWVDNQFGLDLTVGHIFAANRYLKVTLDKENLLSPPSHLLTLDYNTIVEPSVASAVELIASRDGIAHGFTIWFDSQLGPDAGFSNAPGEPEQVYGQCFFPFEQSIKLTSGNSVNIAIRADLVAGSYIWTWESIARRAGFEEPLIQKQSTFRGTIISPSRLEALSPNYIPPSVTEHAIDKFCLTRFDGKTKLGEIAVQLARSFPAHFADDAAAFRHASRIAQHYSDITADCGEDHAS